MVEPEKPFACTMSDCGMTFTNEDHLQFHMKKHDMVLSLGMEQKAAFVADQTPTPTRFIRNCEEVGLFQDLQNVNPFDEGFKRAMETKAGLLSIDNAASSSDELHTPQMVFPLIDGDSTLYSTTNNKNITISRSSSDESGAIKEFETTTISKLTNEVTTISRIVGKTEEKHMDNSKNDIRKDSVSYTNNVIKISNMVRKDSVEKNPVQTLIYEDTVIRDSNMISKDTTDRAQNTCLEVPPMMSQKSLDFIVDSLNTDFDEAKKKSKSNDEDYEVIIKLPSGKQVRMRAVDEVVDKTSAKEALKKVLTEKVEAKQSVQRLDSILVPNMPTVIPSVVPITAGTLIPVTLVNSVVHKVPITPLKPRTFDPGSSKRRKVIRCEGNLKNGDTAGSFKNGKSNSSMQNLESKNAASRRYRARLKETYDRQTQENIKLREANERLYAEKAVLKTVIVEHLKICPNAAELMNTMNKMKTT